MINLCGISLSNYYNKVKLVLLEKDIAFSEEKLFPSQEPSLLARSPLGKIPFIETEQGCLTESQVILEYLEESYPNNPLYPVDSYQKAKCRELIQHIELNVELHLRRLYKEAFFGGTVSEETKAEVLEKLNIGLHGLASLTQFSPYIAGDTYTAADCVAIVHFFMISVASQKIYGIDKLAEHIPAATAYMALVSERPAVQKMIADRTAVLVGMGLK
ncbi:MAG: glutathione S-transferase [Methylococcaceae bacterium]